MVRTVNDRSAHGFVSYLATNIASKWIASCRRTFVDRRPV
jgi:hypothetical protein